MGFLGFLRFSLFCFDFLAWPAFALGYPLWASVRAIETNSKYHMKKLVTYWTIFSLMSLFEIFFFKLTIWVPLWPYIKLVTVVWLVIPQFKGACHVYEYLVHPCLSLTLEDITNWFCSPKEKPSNKESFLASAETYLKENGSEALEKLLSNKAKNKEHILTGAEAALDVVKKVEPTEKNVTEEEQLVKRLKPHLVESEKKEITAAETQMLKIPTESKETIPLQIHCLKRVQREWTCAMCQVTTTSEATLNDHLLGSKHKAMFEKLNASTQAAKDLQSSATKQKPKSEELKTSTQTGNNLNSEELKTSTQTGNNSKSEMLKSSTQIGNNSKSEGAKTVEQKSKSEELKTGTQAGKNFMSVELKTSTSAVETSMQTGKNFVSAELKTSTPTVNNFKSEEVKSSAQTGKNSKSDGPKTEEQKSEELKTSTQKGKNLMLVELKTSTQTLNNLKSEEVKPSTQKVNKPKYVELKTSTQTGNSSKLEEIKTNTPMSNSKSEDLKKSTQLGNNLKSPTVKKNNSNQAQKSLKICLPGESSKQDTTEKAKAAGGQQMQNAGTVNYPGKLWCSLCHITCSGEIDWYAHIKGRKHLSNISQQDKLWCAICNVKCCGEIDMNAHLIGRKHLSNMQIMGQVPLW